MLQKMKSWCFNFVEDAKCMREAYREIRGVNSTLWPVDRNVAAQIYQAFGCIDPDVLPEGEWERVMDWLSSVAHGEPVGDLLPVNATEEYMHKLRSNLTVKKRRGSTDEHT